MAFEEAGVDLGTSEGLSLFKRFLSLNGPAFYGFPPSQQEFQMSKIPSQSRILETAAEPITPLPLGLGIEMTWSLVC
jgi:dihydroorotase